MTASPNAVRPTDNQPNLNELSPTSPACVIEFFEARHRLLTDSERIAQENEIDRQVQAIRRGRSVGLLDALEEGFYWLISAAVLAYLALGYSVFETSLCLRAPPTVDVANYQAMTSGNRTIVISNRFNKERTDCGPFNQSKRRLVHPESNATTTIL